jgi:hypothetical protein
MVSAIIHTASGQGTTYRLRVFTFNGEGNSRANFVGVDIAVLNQETQALRLREFPGALPPPNTIFYFDSSEMPPGSRATVCALYHGTTSPISCKIINVAATGSSAEYASLNLGVLPRSPGLMR